MTDFDLTSLDPAIERRREERASLGVHWQPASVPSPYPKPSSSARFESEGYVGQLTLWASGEAELEVGRIADGRRLCKTYIFSTSTEIDSLSMIWSPSSASTASLTARTCGTGKHDLGVRPLTARRQDRQPVSAHRRRP
jgi:hypothetical protein